jgi:hypothetical protein
MSAEGAPPLEVYVEGNPHTGIILRMPENHAADPISGSRGTLAIDIGGWLLELVPAGSKADEAAQALAEALNPAEPPKGESEGAQVPT